MICSPGRYQQIATDSAAICRIKRIDCKTEGCGTGSAQDQNVGRCYGVNYNFIGSFDNGNPPSVFANSGREIVMTPMQAGTLLHFKNGSCARLSGRDQLARIPQRFARAGSRLLLRCRIGRRFGCDANFRDAPYLAAKTGRLSSWMPEEICASPWHAPEADLRPSFVNGPLYCAIGCHDYLRGRTRAERGKHADASNCGRAIHRIARLRLRTPLRGS